MTHKAHRAHKARKHVWYVRHVEHYRTIGYARQEVILSCVRHEDTKDTRTHMARGRVRHAIYHNSYFLTHGSCLSFLICLILRKFGFSQTMLLLQNNSSVVCTKNVCNMSLTNF